MKIQVVNISHVSLIEVDGPLMGKEIRRFCLMLSYLVKCGYSTMVIDFSNVKKIDYRSFGVLVEKFREMKKHHVDIKLIGVNAYLEELFHLIGVMKLFGTYKSREEALITIEQEEEIQLASA